MRIVVSVGGGYDFALGCDGSGEVSVGLPVEWERGDPDSSGPHAVTTAELRELGKAALLVAECAEARAGDEGAKLTEYNRQCYLRPKGNF